MQLQTLALVRKRPVAQLLGIAVAAAFFLLSASTAKANLIGSYDLSSSSSGISFTSGGFATTGPSGTFAIGTGPSYCLDGIGGVGCGGGSGITGSIDVTASQVIFTFYGSTTGGGSFTFDMSGFGNRILGLSSPSGSLTNASIASGFTGSTMTFTFSSSSYFDAINGRTVTFNVTSVPEVSSGILLFSILLPGLLLVGWRRKEIFGGSEA